MKPLSHRNRLEACLAGEQLDQVPVALWRHFPVDDLTPEGLAAATAAFQRQFSFDFIKVSPNSSYCLKDWGARDRWVGNMEGTLDYTHHPIRRPEDWARLNVLDPKKGSLADQITCLRILVSEFSPQVPIMASIFSPLAQAKNLAGSDQLLLHMRQSSNALHAGLETITKTTLSFLEEVLKTGVDGIFYAVQHAQHHLLSPAEFQSFGKDYDLRVLDAARDLWLNMVHIHGENIMFDEVATYPAAILNWHDRHTPPSLEAAQGRYGGAVCGGLRRWETMVRGVPAQIYAEAKEAIAATGGRRFILGTGCVLPIVAPYGNILAARRAVLQDEMI